MHEPPCEPLKKCRAETSDRLTTLEEKVCKIERNSDAILEILNTWNEGKSVVKWMKIGSKIVMWLSGTSIAIVGIYQSIRHFGQ
jgi:hypothetical protein